MVKIKLFFIELMLFIGHMFEDMSCLERIGFLIGSVCLFDLMIEGVGYFIKLYI